MTYSGFVVNGNVVLMTISMSYIYIITGNGVAKSLSDLAGLSKDDKEVPRGRWLFVACGIATIMSGLCSGPPIVVAPQSAPGISAGARTGLNTLV